MTEVVTPSLLHPFYPSSGLNLRVWAHQKEECLPKDLRKDAEKIHQEDQKTGHLRLGGSPIIRATLSYQAGGQRITSNIYTRTNHDEGQQQESTKAIVAVEGQNVAVRPSSGAY